MKKFFRIFGTILSIVVILAVVFALYINQTWDTRFSAPYPQITVSTDSTVIARGRYLAYGPAHCGVCHVPTDMTMKVDAGELMPLIGGYQMDIDPIGKFRAPNLTPCKQTGIGRYTDAELARTLRYSVGSDNRHIIEFMPFQNLSEEDLVAVISFLRSQDPVKNEVAPSEWTFMGKAIFTLMGVQPTGPKHTPPVSVPVDTMPEYGRYLAYSVANCYGCHTNRNLQTGQFIGEPFAGGMYFAPDKLSLGFGFITPNLTPDNETGIMARWDEKTFVNRFKAGRVHKGSHMPWGAFSRMTENDLKAIYRFLQTVPAVNNPIDKIVFAPGEKPMES